ncbi:hypothetical protein N0V84_005039 [Fusarium piperis]|uniref:Uncharacterized protein n=1 Tax=Fusarium piperis TaxID=1435070 RepID=A0A9W8WEN2_9HYPO|nr:hypothetical protein N0V84_005039 [Fusarium piperis]
MKHATGRATEQGKELYMDMTKLMLPRTPAHPQQEYTIYPVDGQNLDQCNATDASLGALLDGEVEEPMIVDGIVLSWEAPLTTAQVEQVEAIDGVELVWPVHKALRDHKGHAGGQGSHRDGFSL